MCTCQSKAKPLHWWLIYPIVQRIVIVEPRCNKCMNYFSECLRWKESLNFGEDDNVCVLWLHTAAVALLEHLNDRKAAQHCGNVTGRKCAWPSAWCCWWSGWRVWWRWSSPGTCAAAASWRCSASGCSSWGCRSLEPWWFWKWAWPL